MSSSLPVELNRDRIHEIRVVDAFEADGPFAVDLVNEGESVHVHVTLDDDLSRVAALDGGNHYVEAGTTATVPVEVAPVDEAAAGVLRVSTGYGAETAEVEVTVRPWEDRESGVPVSEELATPREEPVEAPASERGSWARPSVPRLALAGVALAVAAVTVSRVRSPPVLVGVGVVVGAALAALVLSAR